MIYIGSYCTHFILFWILPFLLKYISWKSLLISWHGSALSMDCYIAVCIYHNAFTRYCAQIDFASQYKEAIVWLYVLYPLLPCWCFGFCVCSRETPASPNGLSFIDGVRLSKKPTHCKYVRIFPNRVKGKLSLGRRLNMSWIFCFCHPEGKNFVWDSVTWCPERA